MTESVVSASVLAEAAALAMSQLLDQLEPLVGVHGTNALYVRTVHLVQRAQPGLLAQPRGQRTELLAFLREDLSRLGEAEARQVFLTLSTTFADLLTSLIGEPLTNRLLRAAWNQPAPSEPS